MLTKNERMRKLNSAGIDTKKYFTLNVDESIPAGAKIHIIIDGNGVVVPEIVKEDKSDAIVNQIIEDGYVRNTKLHRRFVMAQMFQMLNYVSYNKKYRGYNDCLKRCYNYDYTLTMMLEEVRVLSKLEARDKESFEERAHFFNKDVVAHVLTDYLVKLIEHIDALPTKKCKGVPYKKINGVNIFVADINKKIYDPIRYHINKIMYAKTYAEVYVALNNFMDGRIKLDYDTPKSKAWIDAYKGNGAYYTMKNMVMFHNCVIISAEGVNYGANSLEYLTSRLDAYKGEGWRMFALMNKVIADNNFDFTQRMSEVYSK